MTTTDLLTDGDRALLARPLHAMLTVAAAPGARLTTPRPVWFEHRDGTIQLFSFASSPKVRRILEDPWAAVLVASPTGEPESWVEVQGPATVDREAAREACFRIAERYWDLDRPELRAELDTMLAEDLVRVVVTPEKVARYAA